MSKEKWELNRQHLINAVDLCEGIEFKGKKVPYTSSNGYMFSLVNKEGQLGVRLPKTAQYSHFKKYGEKPFLSHGAQMKDYVLIPLELAEKSEELAQIILLGHAYVMSLKPK